MEQEMINKINRQLRIVKKDLYCVHNKDVACEDCMKNIFGDVSGISGIVSGLSGIVSGLYGSVTGLSGNVTGIYGDVSGIYGDVSGISGNVSGISGIVIGISGSVTEILSILTTKEDKRMSTFEEQKIPQIEHIGEDYVNVIYYDRETNEPSEYELPLIVADIIETFQRKIKKDNRRVREAIEKCILDDWVEMLGEDLKKRIFKELGL